MAPRLRISGLGPEQADASGLVVGDCLLAKERHTQYADLFSCSPLWAGSHGE